MKQMTFEEFEAMLRSGEKTAEESEAMLSQVRKWVERGAGVAVYVNQALDSSRLGDAKYLSFGDDEAALPPDKCLDRGFPPQRLPDFGAEINWAYQLEAVVPPSTGDLKPPT